MPAFKNLREHTPRNMSRTNKHLDFLVGDLVYFVGYEAPTDHSKLGIVTRVRTGDSHFPLYDVLWIKDKLISTHTAGHIDLAYTEDIIDDEVSPKSILHLKDRVYDRSEGD